MRWLIQTSFLLGLGKRFATLSKWTLTLLFLITAVKETCPRVDVGLTYNFSCPDKNSLIKPTQSFFLTLIVCEMVSISELTG